MYGALIGDIVGSRFEFRPHKSKEFTFFHRDCSFTDDSVMTIAVARALYESKKNNYEDLEKQLDYYLHEIGRRYPNCGYGGRFYQWVMKDLHEPYKSFGNGSAMRTSMCGEIAESLEECLELAQRCAAISHNHPEGIRGAQAISVAIYLAKKSSIKQEIKEYIEKHFYKLDFSVDDIRKTYRFDVTCQGSVPQAIVCFLESENFEDAIRNAVSLGGDCDTQGAMAGSIAEAFYGIPDGYIEKANAYLDDYLLKEVRTVL